MDNWDVPISTKKEFIQDKKVDYRIYTGIMLMSNSKQGSPVYTGTRFLMGTKMDNVKNEICEMTGLSKYTVNRHISALRKMNVKQFQITQNEKGKVMYILQFTEINEDGDVVGGDFVTIPSDTLRKLVNAYSDTTIKIYSTLCWMCKYEEKHIPLQTIGNQVNIKKKNTIIDCLEALEKGGFISKRRERYREEIFDKNGDLKSVIRDRCYYMVE